MAINKNHLFDELDGIKCSIVETLAPNQRADFLKKLLEFNGYTVIIIHTPPPKTAPAPPPAEGEPIPVQETIPETFTVGVTHLAFNAMNAIFGRLLKTPDGHVVTQLYWLQKEDQSHDEIPYYERTL
ncbi:MAG TPA: hypothetical protein VK498_03530 [Ferruginibacter sp.]|nr:hypothetical protein [Ferruginibacter sp.]